MVSTSLIDVLSCPDCYGSLSGYNSNLKCNKCDNNIPIIDGIPRFYKLNIDKLIDYNEVESVNPKNWKDWRKYNYEYFEKKLQNVNKSALIFDIGAGIQTFAELLGQFNTYTADFIPYKGIDVVTDLNMPLPVKDNVCDIIVMSNLIEHIPEPLTLLKESRRILNKGGKVLITVPFLIKIHQAPIDYLRYTEFMLHRLLEQAGFENIEITKILKDNLELIDQDIELISNFNKYSKKKYKNKIVYKLNTLYNHNLYKTGGPLIAYLIQNHDQKKSFLVYGLINAPGNSKISLIKELETIIINSIF